MNINPRRILLIQLRKIGDVLMTTPAVRALKNRFGEAKITFLTELPAHEILTHSPYVDEILLHNRQFGLKDYINFIKNLRRKQFDLVIDFLSNPRSALISFLTGVKYRIGFNFRGRAWFYTSKVKLSPTSKNLYSPLHKLQLLKPLGIENDDYQIEFFCSPSDYEYAKRLTQKLGISGDDFIVALCPSSGEKSRVWQAEKFAWLGDKLIEKYNAKILFMWGPNEEDFITHIKSKMKHRDRTLSDYKIPTISQVRALFEKVDFCLSTDNGLRHIAIAANIPTIAVFGQTNPYNWTPPANKLHKFVDYDPGCKKSCNLDKCRNYRCINEVSEIECWERIEELIKEIAPSRNKYGLF